MPIETVEHQERWQQLAELRAKLQLGQGLVSVGREGQQEGRAAEQGLLVRQQEREEQQERDD